MFMLQTHCKISENCAELSMVFASGPWDGETLTYAHQEFLFFISIHILK